jgi:hypothetical protein
MRSFGENTISFASITLVRELMADARFTPESGHPSAR